MMFDSAPQELSAVHIAQACRSDLAQSGEVSVKLLKPDLSLFLAIPPVFPRKLTELVAAAELITFMPPVCL